MDEPFKSISNEYQENVKKMLTYLSESFGFQFIIVTHIQNLIVERYLPKPLEKYLKKISKKYDSLNK